MFKQPCSLSDHSSIITWLNININISELEPSHDSNQLSRLPIQFLWEKDSAPKFKDILRSADLQIPIREYIDDDTPIQDVNITLEKVENILIIAAKKCLKIKTGKKKRRIIKPMSNKMSLKKNELRKLSNQKHRDPLNANLREKYHVVHSARVNILFSK